MLKILFAVDINTLVRLVERMHIKFTLFNHFIATQNLVKHFNRRFFTLIKVIYVKKIFHVNSLNIALSEYVKLVNICTTYEGHPIKNETFFMIIRKSVCVFS